MQEEEEPSQNIGGEAILSILLLIGTYLLVVNISGEDAFYPFKSMIWRTQRNATGACAVVSLLALPLSLVLWVCGEKIQAFVVAYLWCVPFGLAASIPTNGWLGVASTLATGAVSIGVFDHPSYPASLTPPVALVSGAVLAEFSGVIGESRPYWHVFAAGSVLLAALEMFIFMHTPHGEKAKDSLLLAAQTATAMGLAYFFGGIVGVSAVTIVVLFDWHDQVYR